jgi:hypothetical protein
VLYLINDIIIIIISSFQFKNIKSRARKNKKSSLFPLMFADPRNLTTKRGIKKGENLIIIFFSLDECKDKNCTRFWSDKSVSISP